jgi:hypothetical protein
MIAMAMAIAPIATAAIRPTTTSSRSESRSRRMMFDQMSCAAAPEAEITRPATTPRIVRSPPVSGSRAVWPSANAPSSVEQLPVSGTRERHRRYMRLRGTAGAAASATCMWENRRAFTFPPESHRARGAAK